MPPPIAVRSQATAMPVDAGFPPAVITALKVVMFPAATVAGLAEPVPEGLPGAPQEFAAVAELRGVGAPTVKSVELLLVSVQPAPARSTAVAVAGAGAGLVSEQLAVAP